MPKVLPWSSVKVFSNAKEYKIFKELDYAHSIEKSNCLNCTFCNSKEHKMRVQYLSCVDPVCNTVKNVCKAQ